MMNLLLRTSICALICASCVPKENVRLLEIRNLTVESGIDEKPVLAGDAVFFNPNTSRMKLKEIKVDVFIDERKSASVDQKLNKVVKAKSEFIVPLKVQLQVKDIGLVDALKSLFGGKKYEIHYVGYLRVNVNGVPMRIPVDHKEEFKLKF